MKPQSKLHTDQTDLFRMELGNLIDLRHELARLSEVIDWEGLDKKFGALYVEDIGRPGLPTRLMAGLLYLQHAFDLSDEEVVARWVENPYYQYFCGEAYFQHRLPLNPSSLSRYRKRIGPEGCSVLLGATVAAGMQTGTVSEAECREVVVDTTVMEKAVAHPTDSKLYHRARERLVALAKAQGVPLRQSYARKSQQSLHKAGRYGHARQFRRMRKEVKHLKNWLGRVVRDIGRKIVGQAHWETLFAVPLALAGRLLRQQRDDRHKLYSLHAPEVECIAKGKARKPYEFGVKVAIATPVATPFVIASHALPGNPYDGHTLYATLLECFKHTGQVVRRAFADRGYRGSDHGPTPVHLAGKVRGLARSLRRKLKRRNAIEPLIGHMKADGKMGRNWIKGSDGDAMHALLCGAGQNLRLILKKLRLLFARFLSRLLDAWQAHAPLVAVG